MVTGLVSTIQHRERLHDRERKDWEAKVNILQQRLKGLEKGQQDEPPEGYKPVNGHIATTIPIGEGYSIEAKWVKKLDDGRAAILGGHEPNEEPYIIDVNAAVDYTSDLPVEGLPHCFLNMLIGLASHYYTLCDALRELDDWTPLAEVQRYHRLNREHSELQQEIRRLTVAREALEETIDTCRFRLEAARVPQRVAHLERRAEGRTTGCELRGRRVKKPRHAWD